MTRARHPVVRGRYRIVVVAQRGSASAAHPARGFRTRLKIAIVGTASLIIAASVVVVLLIFGSILLAVLCMCFVLIIAVVIVKSAWQKLERE